MKRIAPWLAAVVLLPALASFAHAQVKDPADLLPASTLACVEFRHPTWFTDNVYAILRAYGAALVIGDRKGLDFQTHEMTTDWTLVRFHHGHRGRRGNYSESELEEWAQRFERWRRDVEIYAYFNNDWEVFAPRNARWLRKRLSI